MCTVEVNFEQSSYEVMEDGGEVMIVIELSQPSSEPFDMMISLMDITAKSCYLQYVCLSIILLKLQDVKITKENLLLLWYLLIRYQ